MKKFAIGAVLAFLILSLFFVAVYADSPLPTPTAPPPPGAGNELPAPVMGDPTNLRAVLVWLAGGGAGAFMAVWLEKRRWFQNIAGEYKPVVVLACIAGAALLPQLLLDFVPAIFWDAIAPYFTTVIAAILIGFPVSQVIHKYLKA